jgi:hypothetical protein
LRESGFASMRIDGTRRVYTVEAEAMKEVDGWLDRFRGFWSHKLEVARGKRQRRHAK